MRVADRLAGVVDQQVLLGHVGDRRGLIVLGQQVVVGLVLAGPDLLRDRQPPLLGVGELGVDVEDDSPEREDPVTDDLTDGELGLRRDRKMDFLRRRGEQVPCLLDAGIHNDTIPSPD